MSHLPRIPDLTDPIGLLKEEATLSKKMGPLTTELLHRPAEFGLGNLPESQGSVTQTTKSICGFCSTGCSLTIHSDENGASNLTPTHDYPVNIGMACPKGWEALSVLDAPNRATMPLFHGQEVSWSFAAEKFCENMKKTQEKYGKHSVAYISTGQIPFEEMAFLGAFFKFGMGAIHADGNTRQCMATSVVAYKQAFGFDAPPYSYIDYELSEHILFVGANPCIAHPIMWQRVLRNQNNPRITVIDPRRTETAQCATHHLAPRPKTDQTLFYGLAHIVFARGLQDDTYLANSTENWQEYKEFVQQYPPEKVAADTGLSIAELEDLAESIATKRTSLWWTMGINQSHQGVRTAQSIINLALITGNIGKPGTGANSITGQCNAMGSRLFSNTTNLLGGHDFANEEHRQKVADIIGVPVESIPSEMGKPYNKIIDGILAGEIKALWIIATNPAHSWINQNCFKEVREKLDFLVVQDMYNDTETAEIADLVLPAASWGEKNGCFINSERRVSAIRPIKKAPGQALSDFRIIQLLAHTWGCGDMFSKWTSPQAAFEMLKQCTKGMPCDITGITGYEMLEERGGMQWPFREGIEDQLPIKEARERRLFADGKYYTPSGKAKFLFCEPTEVKELPCSEYPFYLNTGRGTSSQWHTQTRTRTSAILRKLYPADPYVEISPEDAADLEIENDEWLQVTSRRGSIRVRAYVAPTVKPGDVFVPMHDKQSNQLTYPDFDPYSFQPSYKTGAVKIEKV